jgi:G:T-mismatch repair DNA endonuclease (very short patch repair protein)
MNWPLLFFSQSLNHRVVRPITLPQFYQVAEWWADKISGNKARDERVKELLERQSWQVLTVWECEISADRLAKLNQEIQRCPAKLSSKSQAL